MKNRILRIQTHWNWARQSPGEVFPIFYEPVPTAASDSCFSQTRVDFNMVFCFCRPSTSKLETEHSEMFFFVYYLVVKSGYFVNIMSTLTCLVADLVHHINQAFSPANLTLTKCFLFFAPIFVRWQDVRLAVSEISRPAHLVRTTMPGPESLRSHSPLFWYLM